MQLASERLLTEPDLAALRQRLLLARQPDFDDDHVRHAANWRALLAQARRSYAADVGTLLAERRHLLEDLAALRRVVVVAEAAVRESRAGGGAERLAELVRALEIAGYSDSAP